MSTPEPQTFERKVLNDEKTKLTYYTEKANIVATQEKTENMFINLSVKQILVNLSNAFVGILNDFMSPPGGVLNTATAISILTKEDRLIYVGLLVLFISFSIYLIDITG
jgi:hypothetical protein